jgi:hypothetical protein
MSKKTWVASLVLKGTQVRTYLTDQDEEAIINKERCSPYVVYPHAKARKMIKIKPDMSRSTFRQNHGRRKQSFNSKQNWLTTVSLSIATFQQMSSHKCDVDFKVLFNDVIHCLKYILRAHSSEPTTVWVLRSEISSSSYVTLGDTSFPL